MTRRIVVITLTLLALIAVDSILSPLLTTVVLLVAVTAALVARAETERGQVVALLQSAAGLLALSTVTAFS